MAILATGAGLLASAAPASALTRYASPDPGAIAGGACTDPTPPQCTVWAAVVAALGNGASDEVILAPGTYPNLTNTDATTVGTGDTVHGTPGATTVIPTSAKFPFVLQPGSVLRDVSIIRGAGGCSPAPCDGPALSISGALAERVYVQSDTGTVPACGMASPGTAIIRDSVCWSKSPAEGAIEAVTPVGQNGVLALRNVTAVNTTSNSTGLEAGGNGVGTIMTVFATNVIAQGDDAGSRKDVRALTDGNAVVGVVLDHSNYSTASGTGDITNPATAFNVTSPPTFLDAANGDFREDTDDGSTIDRGTSATVNGFDLGSLALDGSARCLGQAPDIGAYEASGSPCPVPPATAGPSPVPAAAGAPAQAKRCKKGRKLVKRKGKLRCVKRKKK